MFSREQKLLLTGQILGIMLYAFDELAINTIMPFISSDLNGDQLYGAAFSFYMIGSLISVVWAGDRLDRKGPILPLVAAVCAFSLGLGVASFASSMNAFVAARFLQGIGGGALYAVLFSLTAHCYSEELRPKVIGLISAAWLVPAMLGPVTAGWLSDHLSWRAVFILQIPLLLVSLTTVYISLRRFSFDATGAAAKRRTMILALSVALLVTAASLALSYGSNLNYIALAIALVAVAIVGVRSIAPSSMRAQHSPQAALATTRGLVHFSFYAADVMIPLVLVRQYGYSASEAGLVLVIGALGWTAASALAASRRTRYYRRKLILAGNAQIFVGVLGSIAILQWTWEPMLFALSWVLVGAGMGLVYNCASAQLMDGAPKNQIGKTSTVASMSDAIGVVLASGIGGYLINNLNLVSATTMLWCLALISCVALAVVTPKELAFRSN